MKTPTKPICALPHCKKPVAGMTGVCHSHTHRKDYCLCARCKTPAKITLQPPPWEMAH
jgi:hypothetical protein